MVIAYHIMWSVYGRWLPNDPRGGSSHKMRMPRFLEIGPTRNNPPENEPNRAELNVFYAEADQRLQWPVIELRGDLPGIAARAFDSVLRDNHVTCHACAIMTTHVHMVVARSGMRAEDLIAEFQDASRETIRQAAGAEFGHPIWGGPGWKVFLSQPRTVLEKIEYVENNPTSAGQTAQHWPFVVPFVS